jgi:hypothetical protein
MNFSLVFLRFCDDVPKEKGCYLFSKAMRSEKMREKLLLCPSSYPQKQLYIGPGRGWA